MLDVTALLELGDDVTDGVDRYRKPDAGVPRDCAPVAIAELTPITSPCALSSATRVPRLRTASVWMTRSMGVPPGEVSDLCRALTMPSVMLRS